MAVGKKITFKKWKGSNIIPIILRLLGIISIGEEDRHFVEKENGDEKEYLVAGNFIHPCNIIKPLL